MKNSESDNSERIVVLRITDSNRAFVRLSNGTELEISEIKGTNCYEDIFKIVTDILRRNSVINSKYQLVEDASSVHSSSSSNTDTIESGPCSDKSNRFRSLTSRIKKNISKRHANKPIPFVTSKVFDDSNTVKFTEEASVFDVDKIGDRHKATPRNAVDDIVKQATDVQEAEEALEKFILNYVRQHAADTKDLGQQTNLCKRCTRRCRASECTQANVRIKEGPVKQCPMKCCCGCSESTPASAASVSLPMFKDRLNFLAPYEDDESDMIFINKYKRWMTSSEYNRLQTEKEKTDNKTSQTANITLKNKRYETDNQLTDSYDSAPEIIHNRGSKPQPSNKWPFSMLSKRRTEPKCEKIRKIKESEDNEKHNKEIICKCKISDDRLTDSSESVLKTTSRRTGSKSKKRKNKESEDNEIHNKEIICKCKNSGDRLVDSSESFLKTTRRRTGSKSKKRKIKQSEDNEIHNKRYIIKYKNSDNRLTDESELVFKTTSDINSKQQKRKHSKWAFRVPNRKNKEVNCIANKGNDAHHADNRLSDMYVCEPERKEDQQCTRNKSTQSPLIEYIERYKENNDELTESSDLTDAQLQVEIPQSRLNYSSNKGKESAPTDAKFLKCTKYSYNTKKEDATGYKDVDDHRADSSDSAPSISKRDAQVQVNTSQTGPNYHLPKGKKLESGDNKIRKCSLTKNNKNTEKEFVTRYKEADDQQTNSSVSASSIFNVDSQLQVNTSLTRSNHNLPKEKESEYSEIRPYSIMNSNNNFENADVKEADDQRTDSSNSAPSIIKDNSQLQVNAYETKPKYSLPKKEESEYHDEKFRKHNVTRNSNKTENTENTSIQEADDQLTDSSYSVPVMVRDHGNGQQQKRPSQWNPTNIRPKRKESANRIQKYKGTDKCQNPKCGDVDLYLDKDIDSQNIESSDSVRAHNSKRNNMDDKQEKFGSLVPRRGTRKHSQAENMKKLKNKSTLYEEQTKINDTVPAETDSNDEYNDQQKHEQYKQRQHSSVINQKKFVPVVDEDWNPENETHNKEHGILDYPAASDSDSARSLDSFIQKESKTAIEKPEKSASKQKESELRDVKPQKSKKIKNKHQWKEKDISITIKTHETDYRQTNPNTVSGNFQVDQNQPQCCPCSLPKLKDYRSRIKNNQKYSKVTEKLRNGKVQRNRKEYYIEDSQEKSIKIQTPYTLEELHKTHCRTPGIVPKEKQIRDEKHIKSVREGSKTDSQYTYSTDSAPAFIRDIDDKKQARHANRPSNAHRQEAENKTKNNKNEKDENKSNESLTRQNSARDTYYELSDFQTSPVVGALKKDIEYYENEQPVYKKKKNIKKVKNITESTVYNTENQIILTYSSEQVQREQGHTRKGSVSSSDKNHNYNKKKNTRQRRKKGLKDNKYYDTEDEQEQSNQTQKCDVQEELDKFRYVTGPSCSVPSHEKKNKKSKKYVEVRCECFHEPPLLNYTAIGQVLSRRNGHECLNPESDNVPVRLPVLMKVNRKKSNNLLYYLLL